MVYGMQALSKHVRTLAGCTLVQYLVLNILCLVLLRTYIVLCQSGVGRQYGVYPSRCNIVICYCFSKKRVSALVLVWSCDAIYLRVLMIEIYSEVDN